MRIVLVDDEPLAIRRLRSMLANEPGVEIAAECSDGRQAVEALRTLRPDLCFLDIQMPEMDGFEVLASIAPESLPLVVFVTAYDQYALKAFEVYALDYLLKPFPPERFAAALARARQVLASREAEAVASRTVGLLQEMEAHRRVLRHFVVPMTGRVLFIPASEVEAIEASRNYMTLHHGKDQRIIRETMGSLEQRLDPAQWVRVHRSWIVNMDHLKELQSWFGGGYVAVLRSGRKVPLGRSGRARLEQVLGSSV